jgi:AcrR family transcriptional regulator
MRKKPSVYQRQHEDTFAKILKEGKKLCLDKGLGEVTMNDIAKASGISRQRLYSYFPNLDSFFYRIQINDMKSFIAFLNGILANSTEKSAKSKLLFLVESINAYRKKERGDFLLTSDFDTYYRKREASQDLRKEYQATYEDSPFQDSLRSLFAEGQKKGEFRLDIIPEMAATYWANTLQLWLERISIFETNGEGHSAQEIQALEAEELKALSAYLK